MGIWLPRGKPEESKFTYAPKSSLPGTSYSTTSSLPSAGGATLSGSIPRMRRVMHSHSQASLGWEEIVILMTVYMYFIILISRGYVLSSS